MAIFKKIIGYLAALIFSHSSIVSASFDEGMAAYNSGDYAVAYENFRPLAEQSDVHAQIILGVLYANGQGIAKDYKNAIKWYRLAAEQGNAKAQYNLGLIYGNGHGVPQNYVLGYMLIKLASASGDQRASELKETLLRSMIQSQIDKGDELADGWKVGTPLPLEVN